VGLTLVHSICSIARVTLKWAEQRDLVDHDNFLAYGVGLVFFILGTVGLIGSDDILCCFVAGMSVVSRGPAPLIVLFRQRIHMG
jgi:hypothetical protein